MQTAATLGFALILATATSAGPPPRAGENSDAKAGQIMAEVRKALGGEQKLAAVKSLSLRADFRREMSAGSGGGGTFVVMGGGGAGGGGTSQLTGTLEIDVVFPDRFFRQEATTGGLALTRIDGFEGDRPFLDVSSSNPGARIMIDRPAADPARQTEMLKRARSELTRLLLGLIAGASAALPVTYSYAGAAESPDGTAHALDVAGPDDFKARLFVDTSTHLPLMLVYTELEPRVVRMMSPRSGASRSAGGGAAHGAPLTPEQRAEIDKQLREEEGTRKEIEMRMFFADYRAVGGILLPHRITRGTAAATTEEWEVKEFKVNPAIKADRFKVGAEQP